MRPGQEGIQKIVNMGPPTTVTGIRKFVGAVGYFRRFIKNFSRNARPLENLTSCKNSKLKKHPVTLTPAALEAFETLKKKCMTAPVLAFADLEKPFVLETDASGIGLGAVLLQEQEDGKLHPVAYASRALHGESEELPLIQAGVSRLKVGHHGAVWGVPNVQAFHSEDRQQPIDLHHDDTESRHHGSLMGQRLGRIRFQDRVPEGH